MPELASFEIDPSRLQIMTELGSGQFGQVFEAWMISDKNPSLPSQQQRRKGKLVAVKSLKADSNGKALASFLMEAQTLSQFSHPNVLGLIAVSTRNKPLQMVVEHVPYGDVRAVLRSCRRSERADIRPDELLYIGAQVAAGMEHLAALKFVHR